MKLKRKLLAGATALAIIVPAVGTIISCSYNGGDTPEPGPTPPDPPTPPTPTKTYKISFKGDGHTTLSKNYVTVEEGQTFGEIGDQVIATKTVNGKDWTFLHWSETEGGEKISDSTIISSDLTVYSVFAEPVIETFTISFDDDGQVGVTGLPSAMTVEDGTTFGSIASTIVNPTRSDGAKFKYWYTESTTTGEQPMSKMMDWKVIDEDITLYPYFEPTPESEWKSKKVTWEKYDIQDSDPVPADKKFELLEGEFSHVISNFVLDFDEYTPPVGSEEIPVLQTTEEISAVATLSDESTTDWSGTTITANWVQPEEMTPSKLRFEFAFSNLPTSTDVLYSTEGVFFDVTFSFKYKNVTVGKNWTIEDLNFVFTEPRIIPQLTYSKYSSQSVSLTTINEGDTDLSISHENEEYTGSFKLNRKLNEDEEIFIKVAGNDADIINVESSVDKVEESQTYVNLVFRFKNIQNIFDSLTADVVVSFYLAIDKRTEDEDLVPLELSSGSNSQEFSISYHNYDIDKYECALGMGSTYMNEFGSKCINFDVSIQNKTDGIFPDSVYVTATNVTEQAHSPVWFSIPGEKGFKHIPNPQDGQPLQGNNKKLSNFEVYFDFDDENVEPTEPTIYNEKIRFDFYLGDPKDGKLINKDPLIRDVTFVYTPSNYYEGGYDTDDWIKARSFGLVSSIYDKQEDKRITKTATAWFLSRRYGEGSLQYNAITSRDFRLEYDDHMNKAYYDRTRYSDWIVGLIPAFAEKKYVENDDSKYIVISTNGANAENDILEFNTEGAGGPIRFWDGSNLERERNPVLLSHWCSPDAAIFGVDFDFVEAGSTDRGIINSEQNVRLYNCYTVPQIEVLSEWAKYDDEETVGSTTRRVEASHGQVTSIFTGVPESFREYDYEYGTVAGFSNKEINVDGNNVPALYWKSINLNIGGGDIGYIDRSLYYWFAETSGNWTRVKDGTALLHNCGAFVQIAKSLPLDSFFTEAGRGAMFVLRPKGTGGKYTYATPTVAGINWNGRSEINYDDTISSFFDTFIAEGDNLLSTLWRPY